MHPFLPLPISLDTSVLAGPGLFEWHIVITPDLDTLAMVLPANSNAEFQMGDDESEDEYDDAGSEGISDDARHQGLPLTGDALGEYDEDEPEEDFAGHGRGCFGRVPQVNRRLTYRR